MALDNTPTSVRWTRRARVLHRVVGLALALIFTTLAITGTFLSFKGQLPYLQPPTERGEKASLENLLPPAEIAERVLALHLPDARSLDNIDRIELRPSKRVYKVRLEATSAWSPPRELQLDAATGKLLNDGVRGDQLWMDLHSWAVFGEGSKLVLMTLSGLSLLWLVGSGIQLWAHPTLVRRKKRVRQS